jgi:hypothetical protein
MSTTIQQWSMYYLDICCYIHDFLGLVFACGLVGRLGCGRNWLDNHFSFENPEFPNI